MTDFFTTAKFEGITPDPRRCCGCQTHWTEFVYPAPVREEFLSITGYDWDDMESVGMQILSLPLRKDHSRLDLPVTGIPERIPLCLACAVEYMKIFNRLLAETNERRKRAGR